MSIRCGRTVGLALAIAGTLSAGAGVARAQEPERKLRVVTTLEVLARLVEEVGGERIEVEALSDPRQDPHFVEPRPTLMQKARAADLFVEVGLQLELWADKVVDGSGNPRIQRGQPGRVVASQGLVTLELPQVLSREWGDVHPYGNPHVWLDPLNAVEMAANIAAGLSKVDPGHATQYQARQQAFERRIDERLFGRELLEEVGAGRLGRLARQGRLHEYLESRELSAELGGWLARAAPLRGRPVVSYHKTFVYLARRFGLEVADEIEEKPGIPPSARHRDAVLERMRARGVRTVLLEVFYDRTAADYLAQRTQARVVVVPIDAGPQVGLTSYSGLIDRLLDELLASESGG